MIAAKDVGEKAAELLTEEPFRQPRVRELLGPRDYTMAETTRILGSAGRWMECYRVEHRTMRFSFCGRRKADEAVAPSSILINTAR